VPRATSRVLGQTRQQELLHYLRTFRTGHVAELSELLGASPSTIRRDLDHLQDRGLVERVHGGAKITEIGGEAAPPVRAVINANEKSRIAERAASLIGEGSTILVTGGTTTEAMIGHLGRLSRLRVVTNGIAIAAALAASTPFDVIVLGGLLRREEMSLLGHVTVQTLQEFQIDKVFMGAFGIDPDFGLSGANLGETQTDRALISSAGNLVVLADSSKLAHRGPVRLAPIEAVSTLVTDSGGDATVLDGIRARGVEVITC
jgi:DeoR/GlpR family transcriptional regulator of sugar metabolism